MILAALRAHHVPFLICGAHALRHHGYTRPTRDLDLFVSPDAMPALAEALAPIIDTTGIPWEKAHEGILIRIEGEPPVDVTTKIHGVSFDLAWSTRVKSTLYTASTHGRPVDYLGFDALLTNKLASPRTKDHADAAALIGMLRNRCVFGL